jgi:hypothetical protein
LLSSVEEGKDIMKGTKFNNSSKNVFFTSGRRAKGSSFKRHTATTNNIKSGVSINSNTLNTFSPRRQQTAGPGGRTAIKNNFMSQSKIMKTPGFRINSEGSMNHFSANSTLQSPRAETARMTGFDEPTNLQIRSPHHLLKAANIVRDGSDASPEASFVGKKPSLP